jgi:putative endonuclease
MSTTNWLAKRLSSIRTSRQKTGDIGEEQALTHLKNAGLQLVERSFLCKGGEIDLVMKDQDVLVFVEVRKRSKRQFGGSLASITPTKQKRMIHAAEVYLQKIKPLPACRFDVVAIDNEELKWLRNVILQS